MDDLIAELMDQPVGKKDGEEATIRKPSLTISPHESHEDLRRKQADIEEQKLKVKSEYESTKLELLTRKAKTVKEELPPYADYQLSDSEEALSEHRESPVKEQILELPKWDAFCGSEPIVYDKEPHTKEYTAPAPRPNPQKRQKKKKPKPKFNLADDDDIPLPKIEIIRSQPIKNTPAPKNNEPKKQQ